MRPRRVGIFGGTFNPIHIGHLRSAEEVCEAHKLDRILFIPSGAPPHKAGRGVAAAADRVAMARLAIRGNPRFRLSTIEIDRGGHSYSIDTLRALRAAATTTQYSFIMGLDAFRELSTWKQYQALFELCDIIVTSRPEAQAHTRLLDLLPVAAREAFWYLPDSTTLRHRTGHHILFQQLTDLDVSASAIRERIAAGLSARYLIPRPVEQYIATRGLYLRKGSHR